MIARSEWFAPRKYGGWGVRPVTWQGWVYIGVVMVPFMVFQSLAGWSDQVRMGVTIGWLSFLLLDIGHVMVTMRRDEREGKIEALADRNASWGMMGVLVAGMLYELVVGGMRGVVELDPFVVGALMVGAAVKTVSSYVLSRKEL